jgi:hypothetical protein
MRGIVTGGMILKPPALMLWGSSMKGRRNELTFGRTESRASPNLLTSRKPHDRQPADPLEIHRNDAR